ncbi:MAG: winged helix-turn-helix transcriptional regulator [Candidatus Kariarchaeaceae archaeon]|jgi:DNA-binding HxlR family transcriptional regulator
MITKLPEPAMEIIQQLCKRDFQTQEEIRNSLPTISSKTMRYAVRRLLENGIIYRVPNLLDMRSVSYRLATADELARVLPRLSDRVFDLVAQAMDLNGSDTSIREATEKN